MPEFTAEKLLERAARIERQVEVWKGHPEYAQTLRMEAWALRYAAEAVAAGKVQD